MTFGKYLSGVLLLVACTGKHQTVATPAPPMSEPFNVSSLESRYALRGAFAGTVRLDGDSVEVMVAEGVVKAAGRPRPGTVRYRDVKVSVGVGAPSGASWEMRAKSQERLIREGLGEGDSVRVASLRFVIAGARRADLAGNWLVFEFGARDAEYGEHFTTYACSQHALLERRRTDSDRSVRLRKNYELTC
jgi:hypothetical protein